LDGIIFWTTAFILNNLGADSGGTGFVWFYDIKADGWSLDDKRRALFYAG
jgi:hypothetical protein